MWLASAMGHIKISDQNLEEPTQDGAVRRDEDHFVYVSGHEGVWGISIAALNEKKCVFLPIQRHASEEKVKDQVVRGSRLLTLAVALVRRRPSV